jgi:hypothetical protein
VVDKLGNLIKKQEKRILKLQKAFKEINRHGTADLTVKDAK